MNTFTIRGYESGLSEGLVNYLEGLGLNLLESDGEADIYIYIINPLKNMKGTKLKTLDYEKMILEYENTAIDLLKDLSNFINKDNGKKKARLCFVNSLASSINRVYDYSGGFERMISSASNMAIATLFNRLRPLGYSFRLYGASDLETAHEAHYAAEYFINNRSYEEESLKHSDEERLVMRNKYEEEIPW